MMKKELSVYRSYTLEDLINDQSFLLWVSQPTKELDMRWNNIQQAYPHLIPFIHQSRKIIESLHFETEIFDENEQKELWDVIAARTIPGTKQPLYTRLWFLYTAAAIFAGILITAVLLYSSFLHVNFETPYGQIRHITLPDGSQVTLNANSSIRYDRNWGNDEIREVWVEGEAFLKVNHLHQNGPVTVHQRFIVHTGAVNVEVLGTSFNVSDRRGHTEVALLQGKISLGLRTEKDKPFILLPGDIVTYANGKLDKKLINVMQYTSWKEGKLYFKDVPLAKIFDHLEDIYGYKVKVEDPQILTRRLSGTISSKNERVFLETIARTLNVSIRPDHNTHELFITAN